MQKKLTVPILFSVCVSLLNEEIEKIQENIIFSKHQVMNRMILTPEEIDYFNINVFKIQQLKSFLTRIVNKIIFILETPKPYIEKVSQYKILPVPNTNNEEIKIKISDIINFQNKTCYLNQERYKNNLKPTTTCISNLFNKSYKDCTKNTFSDVRMVELCPGKILINNANNLTLKNDCNHINYKLNKL